MNFPLIFVFFYYSLEYNASMFLQVVCNSCTVNVDDDDDDDTKL